jgi:hypothetical protein
MKETIVVLVLVVIAGVALVADKRPKAYRDFLPILITLVCSAAAFFIGMHMGGNASQADLAALSADDDFDAAAMSAGGGVPLFEVIVICALAIAAFLAVHLILEIIETNED